MTEPIAVVYGSSGNKQMAEVLTLIEDAFGDGYNIDFYPFENISIDRFKNYSNIIFGISANDKRWLNTYWDEVIETFDLLNLSDCCIALFAIDNQYDNSRKFGNLPGIIGRIIKEKEGKIIGTWPSASYDYQSSMAELEDGRLIGLLIDEDNQSELTPKRIANWVKILIKHFQ